MRAEAAKCKIWKRKTDENPLRTISIDYFIQTRLFTETFSRTNTDIFRGRALKSDSVCPRKNTMASRDRFKPIRIEENLVVSYNGW